MTLRPCLLLGAAFVPLVAAGLATACGSNVVLQSKADAEGGGGSFVFLDSGKPDGGDPPDGEPPKDALPDYEDPGCTDEPPPIEEFTCNPYAQGNGDCAPGEGCYIFVDYPPEECGQEVYGSFCYPAGPGGQGDPCGGGQDCGVGHVCVVTGSGTQCVKLCNLEGASGCAPGYVCEPIDVKGFGGCL